MFRDLARTADGVLDNLRGDQPAALGLTYEALREVNPRIVCAHLSAYGREGSRAAWPGFDYLMQAEAGHMSLTGEPDGPPERYGLSVVDLMTGLVACFGLLAGITAARATGRGRDVDTSLFDLALFNLNYPGTWYLNAGTVQGREPRSAHPSLVPSQLYRTADGWIFVMCNKEKFWPLLCAELGRAGMGDGPALRHVRGAPRAARRARRACSTPSSRATPRPTGWRSSPARCRWRRCTTSPQALDNPFVAERERRGGVLVSGWAQGDACSPTRSACPTPSCRAARRRRSAPTPTRCCAAWATSDERIAALRAAGAVG